MRLENKKEFRNLTVGDVESNILNQYTRFLHVIYEHTRRITTFQAACLDGSARLLKYMTLQNSVQET